MPALTRAFAIYSYEKHLFNCFFFFRKWRGKMNTSLFDIEWIFFWSLGSKIIKIVIVCCIIMLGSILIINPFQMHRPRLNLMYKLCIEYWNVWYFIYVINIIIWSSKVYRTRPTISISRDKPGDRRDKHYRCNTILYYTRMKFSLMNVTWQMHPVACGYTHL